MPRKRGRGRRDAYRKVLQVPLTESAFRRLEVIVKDEKERSRYREAVSPSELSAHADVSSIPPPAAVRFRCSLARHS